MERKLPEFLMLQGPQNIPVLTDIQKPTAFRKSFHENVRNLHEYVHQLLQVNFFFFFFFFYLDGLCPLAE
jgi:hypothetical protein